MRCFLRWLSGADVEIAALRSRVECAELGEKAMTTMRDNARKESAKALADVTRLQVELAEEKDIRRDDVTALENEAQNQANRILNLEKERDGLQAQIDASRPKPKKTTKPKK